jgi:nucleoside-triphosphatase THEP1
MNATSTPIPDKWLKAAVLGSIWAAFEIIAGSFLHNLRIPFAGTALSMFSVFMLVAFMRHWKETGVIIRAGVVAALMKSISPSAVIFGPMVAIFMEALILESLTLFLGRHLLSFLLAGALAVMWALIQKVINFLIIYGFDLVRVAEAFYQWLVIKTGLTELSPGILVTVILGAYAVAGMLAATGGYLSYRKKRSSDLPEFSMPAHQRSGHLELPDFNNYRAYHILIIIVAVATTLYLINTGTFLVYIPAGTLFLAYALIRYKRTLRYIRKPRIWIQFIFLALAATLLWEWLSTGNYFSKDGLEIGLKMVFRAMVIIFGFSALSAELRNPFVKSILQRNGLSNLYRSINLAFAALPYITEHLPRFRNMFKKRNVIISTLISQSDLLLEKFSHEARPREKIFLLTGPTQSGKTTLLQELVKLMQERGIRSAGFLAPGTFNGGRRDEIFLKPLPGGRKSLLAGRKPQPGSIQFRQFYFNPATLQLGNKLIRDATKENHPEVFILDEVGPMEMQGRGWYSSLELLKDDKRFVQVWVVREKLAREVHMNYMIPEQNIFRAAGCTAEKLLDSLTGSIPPGRSDTG